MYRKKMFYKISTWLLIFLYRVIGPTIRLLNDPEPILDKVRARGKNILFAIWHESTFECFYYYRQRGASALFEASTKGDSLAGLAKFFGFEGFRITENPHESLTVRGTIRFIKYLRAGHDGTVALDGPNGPYHNPKQGIFAIADKSNSEIIPVGVWYEKKFTCFWRWDKYQVPLPFSRAVLLPLEPYPLPPELSETAVKEEIKKLAAVVNRAGLQAEELGEKLLRK
jgi:lysophospholipid acyltransferase (LPLAT)-like uncharacterized protein